MQYGQRKLHRSVTEIRRSRSGRPRRSIGCADANACACMRPAYRPSCSGPLAPVPPPHPAVPQVHYPARDRTTTIQNVRHRNEPGYHAPRNRRSMSSQQKRGFRLPWEPERASDADAAGTATVDPATSDDTNGVASDVLGEEPFRLAGASPMPTTGEAPASSDVPEDTAEAAMIDTKAQTQPAPEATDGGWPDIDRRTSPNHAGDAVAAGPPPIHATGDAGLRPRRENPLVAGLVKAMREAAIASRDETVSRLRVEAEARV